MAKRSISVLALCAQLMLFIALCSDGADGLLETVRLQELE